MTTGSLSRRAVRFALPRLLSIRVLGVLALIVVVAFGGWMWFRDSSFASVQRVTVTGLSGPSVGNIRDALRNAAMQMSTLHMSVGKLDAAVADYPEVRSLSVSTHFPHAVSINAYEEVPVATISAGGSTLAVDGAGVILQAPDIVHGGLPSVALKQAPDGGSVTAPGARATLRVLAAAPYAFLAHVESGTSSAAHGVILKVRSGPQIYFGDGTRLHEKWRAAEAVMASSDSHGATYIDVSDPGRPAAGAGAVQLTTGDSTVTTPGTTTPAN